MNESLRKIVADLMLKTKNKAATWVQSGISAEYMIYLNEYHINIREISSNDIATQYVLKICNNRDGEEIDKFVAEKESRDYQNVIMDSSTNPYFVLLEDLYRAARQSCNDINVVYDKISNEINQKGAVGHAVNSSFRVNPSGQGVKSIGEKPLKM
ncbi:MAG: hypothetical protein LBL79_12720 [Prevotella sp.]|jgi:hypothetical protein|nr:hypothetical protein [Prevotella sp.]